MSFNEYISFQLNSRSNYSDKITEHFFERRVNIETAIQLIIQNIIKALSTQCIDNNKSEEIYKIAKDCDAINFVEPFSKGHETITSKGRGVISEIFGVHLVNIVYNIAGSSSLKTHVVNSMTASIAPVALATLYKINIQNNYTSFEMSNYLAGEAANLSSYTLIPQTIF